MNAEALAPVLRRLLDEDELAFDRLFDVTGARTRVTLAPDLAAPLKEAGLVEGEPDQLWGLARARRLERRIYFLELGEGRQYHQDVWPETDALLDALAEAPAGRCLDVGTGCGILAIEAALRGHAVVATDLYESAVNLARFNAQLNGVSGIDFRTGHLFAPVAGERFDLVLTAPHYGRVFDQLRLEVLRASVDHLTAAGRLFLATALEWEEGQPLGVESLLRPLSSHAGVRVRPIVSRTRSWFAFQDSEGAVPRLTSRHRFLVEVAAGASGLAVEWPAGDSQPRVQVVPLSRLRAGATAAVVVGDDVTRFRAILDGLAQTRAVFEAPLPSSLLDACRWGARACVGPGGAAGALVDLAGAVRTCTHGEAYARAEQPLDSLQARLSALGAEAEARRGCRLCEARPVCSRCLFPAALDEPSYCALMREHVAAIPLFHRLLDIGAKLGGLASPLQLDRWPRPVDDGVEAAWPELTRRWNERALWLLRDGTRASLWWLSSGRLSGWEVDAHLAWLGAQVGDGVAEPAIERGRAAEGLSPRRLRSLVERLARLLGADPAGLSHRTS